MSSSTEENSSDEELPGKPTVALRLVSPVAKRTVVEPSLLPSLMMPKLLSNPNLHRLPWWELGREVPHDRLDCSSVKVIPDDCEDPKRSVLNMFFYSLFIKHGGGMPSMMTAKYFKEWDAFLGVYNASASDWIGKFRAKESKYIEKSTTGLKIRIHLYCMISDWKCAVLPAYKCPFCLEDSPKMSVKDRTSHSMPSYMKEMLAHLDERMKIDARSMSDQLFLLKGQERRQDQRLSQLEAESKKRDQRIAALEQVLLAKKRT